MRAVDHQRVLVELRPLAGFDPARGRAHVRHAHARLAVVHATGVLVDQLRLGPCGLDARGGLDQLGHVPAQSRRASAPIGNSTGFRVFCSRMSVTDDLLRNNEAYAETFDKGDLPLPPAKKLAVVACMDARLDVHAMLGLRARRRARDPQRRRRRHRRRDPLAGDLAAPAGHRGDRPHPPHRLRDADLHRRRLPRRPAKETPASSRRGRRSPSPTSTTTCAARSAASRAARSSRTRTPCAASSTTSTRDACAKSARLSEASVRSRPSASGVRAHQPSASRRRARIEARAPDLAEAPRPVVGVAARARAASSGRLVSRPVADVERALDVASGPRARTRRTTSPTKTKSRVCVAVAVDRHRAPLRRRRRRRSRSRPPRRAGSGAGRRRSTSAARASRGRAGGSNSAR